MARSGPGFVDTPRVNPVKLAVAERKGSFHEIYRVFAKPAGSAQASRCAGCGVPFCQSACPLQNDIPGWLGLASEGRFEEAWRLAASTSALPEICGRICPQDRLCEGACVLEQSGWEGVTIGSVEKWLGDMAFENGWVEPIRPEAELGLSVGIIGAGPAGLAAADRLRGLGYRVTVYDRHDRPGGLLVYGIPGFKLEKPVVERRTRRLAEGGVEFVLDFEVGTDATLEDLRQRHDAVLIATGVYQARRLAAPGSGSRGVAAALDYLITSNRRGFGETPEAFASGRLNAEGKRVVVLGGGDTAMDCVRTAVRQGATSVTCLYRRDRANMPGSRREVEHAEEEGVTFQWLAQPKAILGDAEAVTGVRAARMQLAAPDLKGRRGVEEVPGAEFTADADLVIEALGFEPEDLPALFKAGTLETREDGTLKTERRSLMTSIPGVFAAGDIVRGASLVVWAVRDGQDAAAEIDAWLQANAAQPRLLVGAA